MENTAVRSTLSFGFSKKKETHVVKRSVIDESAIEEVQTDYVKEVDGSELKSVKNGAPKKGPLVIPLISKNRWITHKSCKSDIDHIPTSDDQGVTSVSTTASEICTKSSIEQAAIIELLEEARKHDIGDKEAEAFGKNITIPLLLQNVAPKGYETDEKLNTDIRPEQATLDDYDSVPIEAFGLAMLRGMGWSEGDGIGKNKKSIAPVEAVVRPKGMGLGADRSAVLQDKKGAKQAATKPGDIKNEELLEFKKGINCVVLKGPHKDLYGIIQGMDEDNCRCIVKLALSQEMITTSQFNLKLVAKSEFDKFARYLNKGKSDRYKERASLTQVGDMPSNTCLDEPESDIKAAKRQKLNTENSGNRSPSIAVAKHWICPLLRVKIIDKHFKGGRYYSSKVAVVDVLPDSVVCRSDSGKLLEGLKESQLETVIPRENNSYVMIVQGSLRNQVSQLLERDKRNETVTVQLLYDRAKVCTLDYDSVCEYIGDVNSLMDF